MIMQFATANEKRDVTAEFAATAEDSGLLRGLRVSEVFLEPIF